MSQYMSTVHFISILSDAGMAAETTVKCLPLPLSSDVMIATAESTSFYGEPLLEVLCATRYHFWVRPYTILACGVDVLD